MEEQQMTGQHRHVALGGPLRDRFGVSRIERERFFHETRFAGIDALERYACVRGRRRRHDDRVNALQNVRQVPAGVRRRELPRDALARLGVGIAHRRQLGIGQTRDRADVVLAPVAGPDHSELQSTHR
jgi:hypothetical protein